VKIGPVDPEIAMLKLKKERNYTEAKTYSLLSRFAERAKLSRWLGGIIF